MKYKLKKEGKRWAVTVPNGGSFRCYKWQTAFNVLIYLAYKIK